MLSPLFHYDGSTMASVYFPTRRLLKDADSVMIDEANVIVDIAPDGEVVYLELFDPPALPEYYPLPFYYDAQHDTYDLFFVAAGPRMYSVRATDQPDIDLIFGDDTTVIGLRICNAHTRLPRMNLRP